jgi:predicted amidohydrolase
MTTLSAIQLTATTDIEHNLATITKFLSQLPADEQHLVVLPECCLFFGGSDSAQLTLARENAAHHYGQQALSELAKQFGVYLVAGSIPIATSADSLKFYNTCLVFNPDGDLISRYQKIHLFDVDVNDRARNYRESLYTQAGDQVVVTSLPFANVGLSICYDVRFPELYRQLTQQGADIICVPAAFTQVTGQAHWLPLLQARAIENQVYIVAAGQQGQHENGRETYGHSVIIDPWGEVKTMKAQGEGLISCQFSAEKIKQVRQAIPVAKHNRFRVSFDTSQR